MTKRGPSYLYALDKDQVERLVATELLSDRVLLKLQVYMGLRASEVSHFRADWVSFPEAKLQVPARQACVCPQCVLNGRSEWTPKSDSSVRMLPAPPLIGPDLSAFVQAHPGGFGLDRFGVYHRTKALMKAAGIKVPGLGQNTAYPHVLRSTCATLLAEGGIEAAALCYYMGWSDLRVAQHYVNMARMKGAADEKVRKIFS